MSNDRARALPLPLSHRGDSVIVPVLSAATRAGTAGMCVAVQGEPGTGKKALARLIHDARDPAAPLRLVPCAGRSEETIARELFGEAGTSAGTSGGALAAALDGTLVLEHLDALSADLQRRIVVAFSTGNVAAAPRPPPAWLIATSRRDLLPLVEGGQLRRDLYDLLEMKVRLPPLRERRGDIPEIVDGAWASSGERRVISESARTLISQYDWPGNARELVTFLHRLSAGTTAPVITVRDVERELFSMVTGLSCWGPPDVADPSPLVSSGEHAEPQRRVLDSGLAFIEGDHVDLVALLSCVEAGFIELALHRCAGNKTDAARLLGMHRTTLVEKLRRRGAGHRGTPTEAPVDLGHESATDEEGACRRIP